MIGSVNVDYRLSIHATLNYYTLTDLLKISFKIPPQHARVAFKIKSHVILNY